MNKRMRRVISLALVLLMAVSLLTACGSESTSTHSTDNTTTDTSADTKADSGKKIAVKIAHAGTEDSLMHKAWVVAADYMEANGNFECTIYPNGTLGSDVDLAQAVQSGDIQMSACSTSNLTSFNQNLEVFSLPFAFPNEETAYAVLDGDFGTKMLDSMESACGLKGLGYFESCTYRELS